MSKNYQLKLYVTGETALSQRAIRNLRQLCEEELKDDYEITIIDLLKQPNLAGDERIVATPLLIKELPPPLRYVIGDLSDREEVLMELNLLPPNIGEK
jgi:circadian clock protein KaiB